jgi:cytochrome b6-f complex iron-sulfur subunit
MLLSNDKKINEKDENISRREMLAFIGGGTFFSFIAVSFAATIRFLFPKALYEPPTIFTAEQPDYYPPGSVTLIPEKKTYIVHDEKGIYAMSAICTHLGCTVNWQRNDLEYQCPCHGSVYDSVGTNIAGPAPSPLARLEIKIQKNKRLVVDTKKIVDNNFRLLA